MNKQTLIAILAVTLASASHAEGQDASAPTCDGIVSSDPARMYDFKLGDWDITWRNLTPDGSAFEFAATGHVHALMDGDILLDAQESDYFKGVTFRTYNPQSGEWIVRWLPANGSFDFPISAQLEDCVPVERHHQLAPNGREVEVVTRFLDITETSFSFRQDWSFDAGETWVDNVLHYTAVRTDLPDPEQ